MIAAELPAGSACFSTIYDPEVATQAHAAGVGAMMEVQLGGKLDPDMHGEPIVGTATVRTLTDGEFKLVGWSGSG
jgi:microcystin degradation protein MlrC